MEGRNEQGVGDSGRLGVDEGVVDRVGETLHHRKEHGHLQSAMPLK
jgi:hypothetical protein